MKKVFTRNSVLLVGAAACLPLLSAPSAFAESESHQIVYRVFGEEGVSSAGVSYQTPGGEVSERTVSLPWSTSFQAKGSVEDLGSTVGLYVTRPESEKDSGGLFVCEISVDGNVLEKVERDIEAGSMQCFLGDDFGDEVED